MFCALLGMVMYCRVPRLKVTDSACIAAAEARSGHRCKLYQEPEETETPFQDSSGGLDIALRPGTRHAMPEGGKNCEGVKSSTLRAIALVDFLLETPPTSSEQ